LDINVSNLKTSEEYVKGTTHTNFLIRPVHFLCQAPSTHSHAVTFTSPPPHSEGKPAKVKMLIRLLTSNDPLLLNLQQNSTRR